MPVIYSNYKVGVGSGLGLGMNLELGRKQVPGPQVMGMGAVGVSCPVMVPMPWVLRGDCFRVRVPFSEQTSSWGALVGIGERRGCVLHPKVPQQIPALPPKPLGFLHH